MSPKEKRELAHEHLERALADLETDPVGAVVWLLYAVEAAIDVLADLHDVPIRKQHWSRAQAAVKLEADEILPEGTSAIVEALNDARKDAAYEGEEVDLGDWSLEEAAAIVEEVVDSVGAHSDQGEDAGAKKDDGNDAN
jgi:hypothetical protein